MKDSLITNKRVIGSEKSLYKLTFLRRYGFFFAGVQLALTNTALYK